MGGKWKGDGRALGLLLIRVVGAERWRISVRQANPPHEFSLPHRRGEKGARHAREKKGPYDNARVAKRRVGGRPSRVLPIPTFSYPRRTGVIGKLL